MKRFGGYFLNGLIFFAPVALTLYVCWLVFRTIDGWLQLPIPGAGFVATIALITLVGFLASNFLAQRVFSLLEHVFTRLPLVRLLYTATKDVLGAFVGDKRRFDQPVLVSLDPASGVKVLGFLTQESLEPLGLADHVSVYLPQSYNFAGQMLILPANRVVRLEVPASRAMALIVSGGVSEGASPS